MADAGFVLFFVLFFALAAGFVVACDKIIGAPEVVEAGASADGPDGPEEAEAEGAAA